MWCSYRPSVEVEFVASTLGLEEDDCRAFIESCGGTLTEDRRSMVCGKTPISGAQLQSRRVLAPMLAHRSALGYRGGGGRRRCGRGQ